MVPFTVPMRARHDPWQLMSLLTLGLSLVVPGCHARARRMEAGVRAAASATNSAAPAGPPKVELEAETERPLQVPKGDPPRLNCAQARAIVAEVRSKLPVDPPRVNAEQFADLWVDWFDPHGLWSAAPDSPLADAARAHEGELLNDIERAAASTPCSAALGLGSATKHWVDDLRGVFENARSQAKPVSVSRALAGVNEPAFEDESVSHPARQLAAELGTRIGQFAGVAPGLGDESAGAALSRFFPDYSAEEWSEVVLAAAVRAYVPAIDPHGEWAPLEEEWALFEGDPIDDTEPTLWNDMVRTALGARIVAGARAPLELDDLVLAVDGVPTAGLSVEQIEQLARVDPPEGQSGRKVRLLRGTSLTPLELLVSFPEDGGESGDVLDATRVRYGDGTALVIPVTEVGDHLGDDLANVLASAREDGAPVGVVLDLRGNGGGSTDGAAAAIGLFLPGVPMFPLIHRGVVSEIMRAQEPEAGASWKGPLAVLVDGYTASAAEMIAGAIDSYGRGPLLGAHTFGKGCVQEYFDDHSGQGVLRLTTLLVALPDGSPLQQVGLEPEWALGLPEADEREADLVGSPHGAAGPDVRNRAEMGAVPWPPAHGHVGPCEDAAVCRALARLGTGVPVRRSRAANPGQSHTRRAPRPRPVLGDAEHSAHGFTQSREGRGTSPR
ncbi:MAG TPA: S41 family peptidase [Polyangiaceae bacterium]|jgi:carboxyl-terminal processing protease